MKQIAIWLTDEQFEQLIELSEDAEIVHKIPIPLSAIVITALSRALPSIRYEIDNANKQQPHLRLVKNG